MAYTKIIPIHNRLDKCVDYTQNKEKTSLETAIDYALNREKTEHTCFETAINCDRDRVYRDMTDTKCRWGKAGRVRKGYHVIQSFAPGEVTPEEAHAIGVELARQLLGDRYEVVVSTHLNKAHLHSHLVFNSVSFLDGKMYRDQFKDLFGGDGVGIRGTSDAICLEHGLSIIEPGEPLKGPSTSRAEWEAEQKGKPTLRSLIRRDIDAALAGAYTMRSFWAQLEKMGYTVKRGSNVAHTAIRPAWGKRNVRLDSLGPGYGEDALKVRLAAVRSGEAPPQAASLAPRYPNFRLAPGRRFRIRDGISCRRPRKLTGFHALYFKYLYLLGAIPARRPKKRAAFLMKPEKIRFDRYQEQFRYLMKNRIETAPQLAMQYDALQAAIDALTDQRREAYHLRRIGQSGPAIDGEIAAITDRLRALRRELKLCDRIELDVKKLCLGEHTDYLFLARREKSWLFDVPAVYTPESYENLTWTFGELTPNVPEAALLLHVDKTVDSWPWGSVTLLSYPAVAQDVEMFAPLPQPQKDRHIRIVTRRWARASPHCSLLEVIQYLKNGR